MTKHTNVTPAVCGVFHGYDSGASCAIGGLGRSIRLLSFISEPKLVPQRQKTAPDLLYAVPDLCRPTLLPRCFTLLLLGRCSSLHNGPLKCTFSEPYWYEACTSARECEIELQTAFHDQTLFAGKASASHAQDGARRQNVCQQSQNGSQMESFEETADCLPHNFGLSQTICICYTFQTLWLNCFFKLQAFPDYAGWATFKFLGQISKLALGFPQGSSKRA